VFRKVLIANRGEIAVRLIRACRELDIGTVAVFSEIDRDSLHVRLADEAICVGPAPVAHSYLNIPNIISAALISGAEAIHPGYGLLAENVRFAEICEDHGLVFIGPPTGSMALMGDKARARQVMKKAGLPVLPGTGVLKDESEVTAFINEHGFPLMIKAAAGGGGRGIRVVTNLPELQKQLLLARAEALAAFGDDRIYLERYLEAPRHIEFQVLADGHGKVVHLGERDCSVQRRNQKLIEESPSQAVNAQMRWKMGAAAIKGTLAAGYASTGTMEFLLDQEQGRFYFMEMNTRIQVEHPVTEMVTGLDLIKAQIRLAAGEPLFITQEEVVLKGHAIECRINAEDCDNNFAPCCGPIQELHLPGGPGVRIDTHLCQGMTIQPFYDSLLAKIIAFGADREEALARMTRALGEFRVEGIKTTIPFHLRILDNAFFRHGHVHTGFVENVFPRQLEFV